MALSINPRANVLAQEGPAEEAELRLAMARFGSLPDEYVKLVNEATELEVRFANRRYVRIWGPSGAVEMDEAYAISKRIPGAIPVADDGGGHFIYYAIGDQGWGLYCGSYGNIDAAEAKWVAATLRDLLEGDAASGRLP